MKVAVLASLAFSLTHFRGALIRAMVQSGHDVVACAPDDDPEVEQALAAMGVRYRRTPMQRTGLNPMADLRTLASYMRLMREERPDVVLAYTQKPIIYGGIAARLAGSGRFFAMNSGLGHVFTDNGRMSRRLLRKLVVALYRPAVREAEAIFVFNRDDRAELLRHGIARPCQPILQVAGSGVDVSRFAATRVPSGPPIFLLIGRMLRDKGVPEFVEAARRLRARHPAARFQLLGPIEPNAAGIPGQQLAAWQAEGCIEYLGETRDVAPYLRAASVFVLPTAYREGLPRAILEAMAVGRAVVTTDAPGCRETVVPGENGFLVPVRDAQALGDAMERFILDPDMAHRMGRRSRQMVEATFDVRRVNAMLLAGMGLSDAPAQPADEPREMAAAE